MATGGRTIELDANEVALILGEDGPSMTVRVVTANEIEEGPDQEAEFTEAYEVAVALAMRLLEDPEFHDDVLDWYESRDDIDDDDDDDDGEDGDGDEGGEADGGAGAPPKPAV